MSKKIICLLMAFMMCISVLAGCKESGTTDPTSTGTLEGGTTNLPTSVTPGNTNAENTEEIVNPFEGITDTKKKEHIMMTNLPTSSTLVGSSSLPPIDNQGSVGSCASQAIAYTQFSNAVAKYLNSIDENSEFKPAENKKYCFSPKFTYTYSGAGTAWVYNILMDHGCLTLEDSGFYKIGEGSSLKESGGSKYATKSIKWDMEEGLSYKALQYKATGYEQIWFTNAPYNSQMTTTAEGQKLLFKIKEAIASGNVVVTGGYPSRWKYSSVINPGELGKKGESILAYSIKDGAGGHQVSLVGYDDNITTKANGVTLKGAFLMANSYGEGWQNDGYVWVAYDALNAVSEYEVLNNEKFNRGWTFDQFCFMYWDSDVEVVKPQLSVEVELETNNREAFYATLSRTDATGSTVTYMPHLFQYGAGGSNIHESYGGVVNFGGVVGGEADTGHIALSFAPLIDTIPTGTTYEDYLWNIKLTSVTNNYQVNIKSIKLIDGNGNVIQSAVMPENTILEKKGEYSYTFAFGKELKEYRIDGDYTVQSVASQLYLSVPSTKTSFEKLLKDADKMTFEYDAKKNDYYITLASKDKYILDIQGTEIKEGVEIALNTKSDKRNTQKWKLLKNEDGSYSIYLAQTDGDGRYYAMGEKNGKMVLVTGKDVEACGKFYLTMDKKVNRVDFETKLDGTKFSFKAISSADAINFEGVTVCNEKGETVLTEAASGKTFEKEFTVGKGSTCIFIDTTRATYVYVLVVK